LGTKEEEMPTIYGITLHDNEPLGGVALKLLGADGRLLQQGVSAPDGTFRFQVTAGSWRIQWEDASGEADEGGMEVSEGDDAEVEIVV
jgi:hypothetical protein